MTRPDPDESWHTARPASRGRRPRSVGDLGRGSSARDQDDGLLGAAISMGEVEERILQADDQLAELAETHMGLAEKAANAEADWKSHRDRVIVRIAAAGDRTAADMREAMARQEIDPVTKKSGDDLYREYKVTEAAAESSARAMRSLESRLNAFQTISANLRRVST